MKLSLLSKASTLSKAVVMLVLIHRLLLPPPFFWGGPVFYPLSLLCYAVLSVISSFATILARKRELVESW